MKSKQLATLDTYGGNSCLCELLQGNFKTTKVFTLASNCYYCVAILVFSFALSPLQIASAVEICK